MKFALPGFTQRNLGQTVLHPRLPQELGRLQAGLSNPFGLAPGFAEAEPGALGEFVATPRALVSAIPGPEPASGRPRAKPLSFGDDYRGDLLGEELVAHFRASPGAYFLGQGYQPRLVRDYLGASSWLRHEARGGRFLWTDIGWTTPDRQERYQLARDQIHLALSEKGSFQQAISHLSRDRNHRLELEDLLRAGLAAGDFPPHDPLSRGSLIEWESVRETLLGMRLFSEEQVGLLCPWNSLEAVRGSVRDWAKEGWVEGLHGTGLPMPAWRVTELAVEDGFQAGLYDANERPYRSKIRSTQELHDLAVGDAILLLAFDIQAAGGQVDGLRTELALMAEQRVGAFPDFELSFLAKEKRSTVRVEVVGLGNNYRTGAKAEKVRAGGFKVYVPGFDGGGVRLV